MAKPFASTTPRVVIDPTTLRIARVLVDKLGGREFDYLIPPDLFGRVAKGARVRIPFGGRKALGTVVALLEDTDVPETKLKPLEMPVSDRAELTPELLSLADWMSDYYCCTRELALRTMLPQPVRGASVKHRKRRMVRALRNLSDPDFSALEKKAPKQAAVVRFLNDSHEPTDAREVLRAASAPATALGSLEKQGWISIETEVDWRDPGEGETVMPTKALQLNEEQTVALEAVREALADPANARPLLLHGVTGSGKTEIYLQAIADVWRGGGGAIVLVPEISLTPQTVERFRARFAAEGARVAVLHSHLSPGERHDEWHRIRNGDARIVIGARSAIFAPVENPRLFIVDEEHENSYKQEESPHYQARDLAVVRARAEKAVALLGSATPSMESYRNADTGKYRLLSLTKRVDDQSMPLIRVIDMRTERLKQKGFVTLSGRLVEELRRRLSAKEQSILFLNRRGYASSLVCPACGHVCGCPHCSVALTWHRQNARLNCHFCDYSELVRTRCPECGKPGLNDVGSGTERIEETLAKLFPTARIQRMDADTMSRKGSYRDALEDFRTGKTDILLGTQMIAKGLHFPNVTLVGIINADLGLHLPDFRAGERTFQLLTQVAGRAGRGDLAGEVIVQTYSPANPSVQFARHHDFIGFYEVESKFREKFGYPPFNHLIAILVRSTQAELAQATAKSLAEKIRAASPPADLLGGEAVAAPIQRIADETRCQILLRTRAVLRLSRLVASILKDFQTAKEVRISVDVDAHDLL